MFGYDSVNRNVSSRVREVDRLPGSVISANNVNTFKNKLVRFWVTQDFILITRAP